VPNDNYCLFEDWLMPKLDAMLAEQEQKVHSIQITETQTFILIRKNK
jgi:deoxyhypusine synthase